MVQLGKAVKGKAPTRETRRAIIRVRMQDQSFEDLDRESQMMRIRRDNLRNAMVEE